MTLSENKTKSIYESFSDYDYSWQDNNLYKNTKRYDEVLKHELIHKKQNQRKKKGDCNHKIRQYFEEVEAYFFDEF